jgi:hypothetical protein
MMGAAFSGLKEAAAGASCDRLSFLRRYFCHLFGYSQTGCFPAEPVSASPKNHFSFSEVC